MINELKQDRPGNARFYKCPSAITSGMPVLIGTQAAVALDAYDSSLGGTVFRFSGTFGLTISAASTQSPVSNLQINPGDELFATGTLDSTTGITYNLTIDKTRGNTPFGNYDPLGGGGAVTAGTSGVYPVKLKEGGSPGPYAS